MFLLVVLYSLRQKTEAKLQLSALLGAGCVILGAGRFLSEPQFPPA